jgi:hypothetical protein
MLMDPWSTFDSIRNNVAFLEEFVGDGWSVAPFCRMLPYAGTPIRRQLEEQGRLLGSPFDPDYKFLDPRLDLFYDWVLATFHRRNFTSEGLCHLLRYGLFEARLRLPGANPTTDLDRARLQCIAEVCNGVACRVLRSAIDWVEAHTLEELEGDREFLTGLMELEHREEQRLTEEYFVYRREIESRSPHKAEGGFDKTWTHWQGDREAAGIGVA